MGTNSAPFEIDVEKLVYGGDGLARRDGQVILTPYVLPGERVEVTAADRLFRPPAVDDAPFLADEHDRLAVDLAR